MKMRKATEKELIRFIAEAGMLKRTPRSGWSVLGIKDAESVADHSFRCAVLGYVIAHMEGVHPYRVLLMTLFNDIQEARITDLHKMAQVYFDIDTAEKNSYADQIERLPGSLRDELGSLRKAYSAQRCKESVIARDADILECLIQAKEYFEQGYPQAAQFMKKAPKFLKTSSAKKLWRTARTMSVSDWWVDIARFRR